MLETDLMIIGAGAAGLMAGSAAAEAGLKATLIERRHRPGLKLLLCGNNRCNVSHDAGADRMLSAYGEPVQSFLTTAIEAFPPRALRHWFHSRGLPTVVHDDGRVFPRSERADDVLHCFTDVLRDRSVPLVLNTPVQQVRKDGDIFLLAAERLSARAPRLLIATGGVSYPKTGSVGDGQTFAKRLGHSIEPYRPGLAGIELGIPWLQRSEDISFPDTRVQLEVDGTVQAETDGEILCSRQCARGPAMVNASRIIGRRQFRETVLRIDLFPQRTMQALTADLRRQHRRFSGNWPRTLSGAFLDSRIASDFYGHVIRPHCGGNGSAEEVARVLKSWWVSPAGIRPLKEAMVTVGGVRLDDIEPATMASRRCDHLWFAGEVMDVDGPTGGYNLHAAFATARLAIADIARRCGKTLPGVSAMPAKPKPSGRRRRRRRPRP